MDWVLQKHCPRHTYVIKYQYFFLHFFGGLEKQSPIFPQLFLLCKFPAFLKLVTTCLGLLLSCVNRTLELKNSISGSMEPKWVHGLTKVFFLQIKNQIYLVEFIWIGLIRGERRPFYIFRAPKNKKGKETLF